MSPGQAWLAADWTKARASIYRGLRIDPDDVHTAYATLPFVIMRTAEDQTWIAGAVGIYPALATDHWAAGDIHDVILWNPKTGAIQILGEAASVSHIITPAVRSLSEERVTVYADGFSFFRDWANQRAIFFAKWRSALENKHHILPREPSDSNIPGALAVGDMTKIHWRDLEIPILAAGPGVDPKALRSAVVRSARIPRIETVLREAA